VHAIDWVIPPTARIRRGSVWVPRRRGQHSGWACESRGSTVGWAITARSSSGPIGPGPAIDLLGQGVSSVASNPKATVGPSRWI
jgi:hypothetical protein